VCCRWQHTHPTLLLQHTGLLPEHHHVLLLRSALDQRQHLCTMTGHGQPGQPSCLLLHLNVLWLLQLLLLLIMMLLQLLLQEQLCAG
jgi:hypothetical protein